MNYHEYSLFKLDKAFNTGVELAKSIGNKINGRLAGMPYDYGIVAQAIVNAGGGNYLEIGTLYGGGAVIASLVMKEFGLNGKVYMLDPLDGYYGKGNKDSSGVSVSVETVKKNFELFGIDNYEIIDKSSVPFPDELKNKEFSVSFIDGNHWGMFPKNDFNSVKDITTDYVIFDNYDMYHPAIISAVRFANDEYTLVHLSSITAVLERNPKIEDKFKDVVK